jgi:hypothetical protein
MGLKESLRCTGREGAMLLYNITRAIFIYRFAKYCCRSGVSGYDDPKIILSTQKEGFRAKGERDDSQKQTELQCNFAVIRKGQ